MTEGAPKRPPPGDPKICGVCGDKALGYNFNAITCESCKAFFRRNALKSKEFKCPFSDSCKVDVVTRRFCQKCRLKKCVEIGMKKEWIMTDEEKKVKKQKIEENRQKRHSTTTSMSTPTAMEAVTTMDTATTSSSSPNTSPASSNHEGGLCSPTGSSTAEDPVELVRAIVVKVSTAISSSISKSSTNVMKTSSSVMRNHVIDVDVLTPTSEERSSSECDGSLESPALRDILSPLSSKILDECSPNSIMTSEAFPALSPCSDWRSPYRLLSPSPCASAMSNASSTTSPPPPPPLCVAAASSPYPSDIQQHQEQDQLDSTVSSVFNVTITSETRHSEICESDQFSQNNNLGAQNEQRPSSTPPNSPSPHPTPVSLQVEGSQGMCELTPNERATIDELLTANRAMKSPITDDDRFRKSVDPSLINVINLTDIAIRRLIKMSKKIASFRRLCQEDQIALLKGSCTELMILRSVMTYNPENECWFGPRGPGRLGGELMRIKLEVLREAKGNVYEEHKRFIQSFDANWRTDEAIMLLLGAITLFEPNRPNVIHGEMIRADQDGYYTLLRRYLESVYSSCEARSAYLKLVQRIDELHSLNENHVRVYLDVNPKEVEPLLIEIFDLKNH